MARRRDNWVLLRPIEALAIAIDDLSGAGPARLTLAFDIEHYGWRARCGGKEAFVPADYATRSSSRTSRSVRRRGVRPAGLTAVALRDVAV